MPWSAAGLSSTSRGWPVAARWTGLGVEDLTGWQQGFWAFTWPSRQLRFVTVSANPCALALKLIDDDLQQYDR